MIFVLTDQIMNGTVTIQTHSSGIEAESFEKAKDKLKAFENFSTDFKITRETEEEIHYVSTYPNEHHLTVCGHMNNQEFEVR